MSLPLRLSILNNIRQALTIPVHHTSLTVRYRAPPRTRILCPTGHLENRTSHTQMGMHMFSALMANDTRHISLVGLGRGLRTVWFYVFDLRVFEVFAFSFCGEGRDAKLDWFLGGRAVQQDVLLAVQGGHGRARRLSGD